MTDGIPVVNSWVQVVTMGGVCAIIVTKLIFYPLILRRTKKAEETYDMVRDLVIIMEGKEKRASRTAKEAVKTLEKIQQTAEAVQTAVTNPDNVPKSESGTNLRTIDPFQSPDPHP